MFEEEAEIYALSNFGFRGKYCQRVLTAKIDYQYGFKDGYNKANEWHYVKDELPISDRDKFYLIVDKWNCPMMARFYCGKWSNYTIIEKVIAWKEIVLPELPKDIE